MAKNTARKNALQSSPWVIPGTLAVIALLFRLLFYSQFRLTPFFENLYSDSRLYADIAYSIVAGDTLPSAVFMSPLYPLFLAFLLDRLGDFTVWARLFQIALGTGTVLLVYAAGMRLFNRTAGYVAALLAALYPAFIYYDNQILLESLLTFTLIAQVYAFIRATDEETILWPSLAGLALGVAIILRGSLVVLLPVVLVYIWRSRVIPGSRLKFAGVYTLLALVVVLPVSIRNSNVAGEFVPLTTSFGLNLHAGNNDATDGRYFEEDTFDGYRDPMGKVIAERHAGKQLTPVEVNAYWSEKALTWIGTNPGAFLGLYFKKILLFFHFDEIRQTGLSRAFITREYGTVLGYPLPPFFFVLGLMLAGLVLAWRFKPPQGFVLLLLGTYIGVTALFFVNDRLRTPVVVLMVLYAGFAVSEALRGLQARSYTRIGSAFTAGALVVVLIGILQPSILQTYDSEYNRLGDAAFNDRRFAEAEKYFALSVKELPAAVNMTNLGNALAAQGKFDEAEHIYEDAIRMNDSYAPAFFNKGNMAHQRGKPEVAFRYWGKTVQLDPEYAPAYRNMGLLLMKTGNLKQAKATLQRYIEVERDPSRQNEIRRDIARIDDILHRTD